MTMEFEADLSYFTDKALLIMLLKGIQKMTIDVTVLQGQVTQLTAVVAALGPALTANADLATKAIAAIENFQAQLATMPATQDAINLLSTSVATSLASLQLDATEVATTNAAVQAELDKVTPTTP